MTVDWQPYREPFRATLLRTGLIAVALGAAFAFSFGRGLRDWPAATVLALWPALGGHLVELLFLNQLRPMLPPERATQGAGRLATWFAACCVLAAGMYAPAIALRRPFPLRWETWWI